MDLNIILTPSGRGVEELLGLPTAFKGVSAGFYLLRLAKSKTAAKPFFFQS
jgi:hypothetical protein